MTERSDSSGQRAQRGGVTLLSIALPLLLVIALLAIDSLVLRLHNPTARLSPHYYVSLGDSLSFGYQPDGNIVDGFTDDLFADLRPANVTDLENFACGGESSSTMIAGGCQFRFATHVRYFGPQLDAVVNFIKAHPGRVDPLTLEIGANDVLGDFDPTSCTAGPTSDADLSKLDTNLTQTILPRLVAALTTPSGSRTADLVLLNYYNPYAAECPSSPTFVHELNDHLAADAAQFRLPVVDVYSAFGGDTGMAATICAWTWMCSAFHDIHPNSKGYTQIAKAIEQVLQYPTGSFPNPLQTPAPPPAAPPAATAPVATPTS